MLVRPLPASVPRTPVSDSKQALIAASFVDYSYSYTPLQAVDEPAEWTSTEPRLTCEVRLGMLTVSYLREGFDTTDLPRRAACEREGDRVRYRIRVVPAESGT